MVTMLRLRPDQPVVEKTPLPPVACFLFWTTFVLDVAVVVVMVGMDGSPITGSLLVSAITLGGHPRIVGGLALAGLLLLAVLAPLTDGFARAGRPHRVMLPIAGVLSLTALAGLLAVIAVAAAAVLAVALLFRPHAGAWIFVSRRRR
jgi:hypothetical protein